MGLGGLWHGAGWHFVLWGVAHGAGLSAGVLWRKQPLRLPAALAWPMTFLFITATWVLFRAPTLAGATAMFQAMIGASPEGFTGHLPPHGEPLIWAAVVALIGPTSQEIAFSKLRPHRAFAFATASALVFVLLELANIGDYQFIYFQF